MNQSTVLSSSPYSCQARHGDPLRPMWSAINACVQTVEGTVYSFQNKHMAADVSYLSVPILKQKSTWSALHVLFFFFFFTRAVLHCY
jgi:hypothetical protein